jgi:hypothetical protein
MGLFSALMPSVGHDPLFIGSFWLTVSLPFRCNAVDGGRWRSSQDFGGHTRPVPYGAVAALAAAPP